MKRKLAEHDNLKITIEQNGDKFQIKESSTFRSKEIDFTLGVQFDYSLADGTEVSVSSVWVRRRGWGPQIWAPGITPVQKSLLIPVKPWRASISGSVGDGGRHDERKIHQKGQQQGPDHHQNAGGRRAGAGQCGRDYISINHHLLVCFKSH